MGDDLNIDIFTFHSGYILITPPIAFIALTITFTFHSGYILIIMKHMIDKDKVTLHSILVIF